MPLVALHNGDPVLAIDETITRATCRDPRCAAVMHRRTGTHCVPHWVHAAGTSGPCAADTKMSLWHAKWQHTCTDPRRIEVSQGRRRTDVLATFGWAIEFQHYNMRSTEVHSREDDWKGRLVWVHDGTTAAITDAIRLQPSPPPTGPFTATDFEWLSPPSRIAAARCHQLVDVDGSRLLWLPGGKPFRTGHDIEAKGYLLDKQTLIDTWINGEQPLYPPRWAVSRWAYEAKSPPKPRAAPVPRSRRLVTALTEAQAEPFAVCERAPEAFFEVPPAVAPPPARRPGHAVTVSPHLDAGRDQSEPTVALGHWSEHPRWADAPRCDTCTQPLFLTRPGRTTCERCRIDAKVTA